MIKKNIEVIVLVYKSIKYLDHIYSQLKEIIVDRWKVNVRIVANDAISDVIKKLNMLDINKTIYFDQYPNAYYLERVYRCLNFAGQTSLYDNICFVNSDMVFGDKWLDNLLKYHNGRNIPCSRLVESGKLQSGLYGISKNFGRHPDEIDYNGWTNYVQVIKKDKIENGGLYMPCVFETKTFVNSGMYPEGNLVVNGKIISGDHYFFYNILKNMRHITVFDSIVYHIQEGEMDDLC